MNVWARRALLVGLGALISPVTQLVVTKLSGRHWLAIKEQETHP
jgi:hypothetical protein